jgi:hypothetical protein
MKRLFRDSSCDFVDQPVGWKQKRSHEFTRTKIEAKRFGLALNVFHQLYADCFLDITLRRSWAADVDDAGF